MISEKTQKRIENIEKIVEEYAAFIENTENSQKWNLMDCKYIKNGIVFKFFDCNTKNHINLTIETIERIENDLENLS